MTLRKEIEERLQYLVSIAPKHFNYEIKINDWEKYGKSRTYFKVVETRDHSKHYVEFEYGYIDNADNTYHKGRKDAFGKSNLFGNEIHK